MSLPEMTRKIWKKQCAILMKKQSTSYLISPEASKAVLGGARAHRRSFVSRLSTPFTIHHTLILTITYLTLSLLPKSFETAIVYQNLSI